jgi:type I restriction enzyme M protein
MLDTDTKRRIDTARDILVGKVPDPKSQVEQITIALIYKFMDDMDAESEEFGGVRKFFAGEFARYGWAKLMHSGLGGFETLNLYAEAIAKMPENPGIPLLFRNIFKNAYLPYRDPETLKMFLKVIDEFSYDHSERLGDAFEYLLSVLGSQGDAGQFRTPRHIIDFMVEVVDPQKTGTVLDPACGTAGFLISSYKHILRANTDAKGNSTLTPDEKGRLAQNFRGYDISPDMVRLSLVNLYLHGFTDPHIYEYDTLTSQDRWNDYADVILANPPFMSPKGGIKPHNRFSVQSKRSEVLFVDYMAEHLTPGGRAGIIVPEGIIFQSQTAYRDLRKMLVDTALVAVISLPAGVFQPYSGVKTSILILDKSLAKKADAIAFFKVENDGFGLGAQRREIDKNDLPETARLLREWMNHGIHGTHGKTERDFSGSPSVSSVCSVVGNGLIVPKERIAANGEYNLSGERYREGAVSTTSFKLVPVGRFMKEGVKAIDPRNTPEEIFELWSIPAFDAGSPELLRGGDIGSQKKVVFPGDVLLSRIIPHIRRGWVVRENSAGRRQIASTEWIVFSSDDVVPDFLRHVLVSDPFHASFMQTITGVGGSLSRANPSAVGEIQIPLPPLDVQKEIVAEIEGYQKVIDGARGVLDNYRPHIPIHPDWPMVPLEDACEIQRGKFSYRPRNEPRFYGGKYPFIQTGDVVRANGGKITFTQTLNEEGLSVSKLFQPPVVVITIAANIGDTAVLDFPSCFPDSVVGLVPKPGTDARYLEVVMRTKKQHLNDIAPQAAQKNINIEILKTVEIPLPPLDTQQAIVAEIEAEQALVAANRELIARFEKKIQATLARVWGEDAPALAGV